MATGGEVQGRLPGNFGPEHLNQRICQLCLGKDTVIDATGLCVDCQDYLCFKCFNEHKVKQHWVLDGEQSLNRLTAVKPEDTCSDLCPVHENEVIQYYCVGHYHLGCKSCIHSDHGVCDEVHHIPRVSKELVNNEDYRQAETKLKSVLNTLMNVFRNAQRNSDEVEKSYIEALKVLQDFRNQIEGALGKIERELVENVQILRLKAEQELAEMKNKYKTTHEELQSSLAKIESLHIANLNCSSYIEMMSTKEKIKSLEDLTQQAEVDISYRQSPIRFYPNRNLLELLRTLGGFGTVSSAGTRNVLSGSDEVHHTHTGSETSSSDGIVVLSHSETESSYSDDFSVISDPEPGAVELWLSTGSILPQSYRDPLHELAVRTQDYNELDLNVKTEFDNSVCMITGMVDLPGSRLVLIDYNAISIKVVDIQTSQVVAQLKLQHHHPVVSSVLPWDITSTGDNEVAVTIPYKEHVAFVTVGNSNLSIDRTLTVDGKCWGVDYRNGKLAVSFIDPHKVQILSINGSVLYSIVSDKSGDALFNSPYYLTFGQGDTLYVSNLWDHNVVCVKVNGTLVATYKDRDLKGPRKAIVDSNGDVFVCARGSNTVHQITKDCKKLRVLLTQADGLDRPMSLCLREEENELYVGMLDSDYVKVYMNHNSNAR